MYAHWPQGRTPLNVSAEAAPRLRACNEVLPYVLHLQLCWSCPMPQRVEEIIFQ